VGGDDDAAQAFEVVGGDGLLAGRVGAGEELGEGGIEGLAGGALGLGLVEDAEARIDSGGDRMGGEDPVAEAVDRGDPGAAHGREEPRGADRGGARPGGAAGEIGADAGAQLGGGLVGEGEGEDGVGGDALVDDEAGVALDHDPGLAGAGAGLEQDVVGARLDRRALLGRGGALDRGLGGHVAYRLVT
jgi:hypothetical protein